jgi:hypothetical protein
MAYLLSSLAPNIAPKLFRRFVMIEMRPSRLEGGAVTRGLMLVLGLVDGVDGRQAGRGWWAMNALKIM